MMKGQIVRLLFSAEEIFSHCESNLKQKMLVLSKTVYSPQKNIQKCTKCFFCCWKITPKQIMDTSYVSVHFQILAKFLKLGALSFIIRMWETSHFCKLDFQMKRSARHVINWVERSEEFECKRQSQESNGLCHNYLKGKLYW